MAFLPTQQPLDANIFSVGATFANNSVNGWTGTGCATVTNGLPVSVGTGGAVFSSTNGGRALGATTTAPAVTSSSAINNTYSLNFATSGAGTIGDGYISAAIPITPALQARALTLTFNYRVVSGSPNMSGTSSNTYACAVYDVANNAWFGVAGAFNLVQSSGVGYFTGTFQTATNTTSVQIFIYNPVAPTGSSSFLLDNFWLGQVSAPIAPAISDWVSFTPTGSWTTNTTYAGRWRRLGDLAEVQYSLALAGAPNTADLTLNLPSGFSIDTSKLATTNYPSVGYGEILDSGLRGYEAMPTLNGTTIYVSHTESGNYGFVNQANPITFGASDNIAVLVRVPITGWSSNTVSSADTATNVVAARAFKTANASTTLNTQINFDSVVYDTNGAITTGAGTWKFTAPVTGYYRFSWYILGSTTGYLAAYKNNAAYTFVGYFSTTDNITTGSNEIQLNAGDYLDLRPGTTQTITGNASQANSSASNITIERISGPAVVQATDTVNMRYMSATAIITSTLSDVTFVNKDFDSTSSYSGATYTAPVSGKFQFAGALTIGGTPAIGNTLTICLLKNGSQTNMPTNQYVYESTSTVSRTFNFAFGPVSALAGDAFKIQISSNITSPVIAASGVNNQYDWLAITRVGN